MRTLGLVTSVLPSRSQFLAEAARGLLDTRTLAEAHGWRLSWHVAVDGPGEIPQVSPDTVAHLAARRGIAAARNVALTMADVDWVLPLDADDILDPDGLVSVLDLLSVLSPDVGWLSANRLLVTGERTPHWRSEQYRWRVGELAETWRAPFPFHPNAIIARRRLVLACGGWPAIPTNEDLALCLSMSERAPGFSTEKVLGRYRVWAAQEVNLSSYGIDKITSFALIEQLINTMRAELGRDPVRAPIPGPAFGTLTMPAEDS
jgi:cellulose synthase/poly-beta-1,6-N-acetylglucosamine synthase-like glycosyltransferase